MPLTQHKGPGGKVEEASGVPFCQFIFAGASNQLRIKQEALLASMDPGIHAAVLLG